MKMVKKHMLLVWWSRSPPPTTKLKSPLLERRLFPLLPHPKVEMLCLPPVENTSASTGPKIPVATLEMPAQVSMDAPSVENPVMELVPANPVLDP